MVVQCTLHVPEKKSRLGLRNHAALGADSQSRPLVAHGFSVLQRPAALPSPSRCLDVWLLKKASESHRGLRRGLHMTGFAKTAFVQRPDVEKQRSAARPVRPGMTRQVA